MKRWAASALIFSTIVVSLTVTVLVVHHAQHLRELRDPRVVRCSDFRTQPEAQERYLSDPIAYRHLDGDIDSIACENLPGR